MEDVINEFISTELVVDQALLPLSNETPLLENDILDSLTLIQLVVFLEDEFGITLAGEDLQPKNFVDINTICAVLRARQPERQESAHE